MKIKIYELPGSRYHQLAAEVKDWFGIRTRYYRLLLTGQVPGGEWVSMDRTQQPHPNHKMVLRLKEAASKHRGRIK